MNTDSLTLTFRDDYDQTGQLSATIESGGFRGEGAAYFSIQQLQRFAGAMRAFPLPAHPPVGIAGGFFSRDEPGVLSTTLLSIELFPVGSLGQLGVRVHVETEAWPSDPPRQNNQATIEMFTTYARVDAFSRELDRLVAKQVSVATLLAERCG